MRILIIDDDDVVRVHLRQLLAHSFPSSELMDADGAAQALVQMRVHLPSLVLLELGMPHGHGYALFKTIRAIWATVPVIVMTDRTPGGAVPFRQLGAAGSIAKSEIRDRLAGVVRAALRFDAPMRVRPTHG